MQRNTLPDDIRPGEEILANRIRMCVPAAIRDKLLPAADPELVRRVRIEQQILELHNDDAYQFVIQLLVQNVDNLSLQDCEFLGKRVKVLFVGVAL